MSSPILEVRDLCKYFPMGKSGWRGGGQDWLKAVDGVSFDLHPGQTLGLVGESGCGKSTCARTIVGLYPPTSGTIRFKGNDLGSLSPRGWAPYRRKIQMIFQDPFASLDPRQTVGSILTEPMAIHKLGKPRDRRLRSMQLLEAVGLNPRHLYRYPHEFSGGQRQRIGIARALALEPEVIICDEPVSALDVSIQAQVLNLLGDLQEEFGLSYIFIAHDLSVVKYISDRVAVMYLGRIVETGTVEQIFENPQHPYTKALLAAIPVPDPTRRSQRVHLEGDVPSPISPPSGCHFHTRCPVAEERCSRETPAMQTCEEGHHAACFLTEVCAASS